MKKICFLLMAVSVSLAIHAQYRDVKLPDAPKNSNYKDYNSENKGFWCAVELGGNSGIMVEHKNMQNVELTYTGGYRLNEFLRIGAGLGVRYYVNNAEVRDAKNKFGIPLFANIRGNFVSAYDRDGVPFWSVNIGGVSNEGFLASPTFGYSFGGIRNNFLIGVSYTISNFKYYNDNNIWYSYMGLKLGYEF